MEICQQIKSLRLKNGMTQKELGKNLGVSTVSIGHWENGTKKPAISAVVSLAKTFNVSIDYLLGLEHDQNTNDVLLSKDELTLLANYRSLDTYGKRTVKTVCELEKTRVDAEQNKAFSESNVIQLQKVLPSRYIPRYSTPSAAGSSVPLDGDDFEMILVDSSVPADADFAVGIQGNSMYPYIHDGDTVYVKRDCNLSIGDVGIFSVDGAMYCKQYYIDENKNLILVSTNPQLKNTNVNIDANSASEVRCYGKVLLDCKVELPDYILK